MTPTIHSFTAPDGVELTWHELGEGRPVILLHGLFSNAFTNWIRYGHAAAIAERGRRVIMPDLRAHGKSAAPHDPACYPPDVLVADGLALIAHLQGCRAPHGTAISGGDGDLQIGLADYDLGGYSLGARTAVRMVVQGAAPGRLVIAGMGLKGIVWTDQRADHFRHILTNLGSHPRGSPEWLAEAFLKTTGGDAEALLLLLDSFVATREKDLAFLVMPTLVVAGEEDQDNGSAEQLAAALPNARHVAIPGGHMSAVVKPELGRALADFLAR